MDPLTAQLDFFPVRRLCLKNFVNKNRKGAVLSQPLRAEASFTPYFSISGFIFMRKTKRLIAVLLVFAMAQMLTACGGSAGGSEGGSGGSSKGSGTLTVAIWDVGQQPGLQEIMDAFTEETGIKTSLQVIEWDRLR